MLKQHKKNFLILSANTLVAQVLAVLSLIVIANIYSPEQFSILVLYSNLLLWLGSIVCLKYDVAIVISDTAAEAVNLVALSIFASLTIATSVFLLALINSFFGLIGDFSSDIFIWLLITPVGIFLTGASLALRSLLHFNKEYFQFSILPIIFATVYAILAVSLFYFLPSGKTLVLSQVLAVLAVCIYTYKKLNSKGYFRQKVSLQRMLDVGRKNSHYPILSTPSSFFDGMSQAMPVYFIALIYDSIAVASYGLMVKIVVVPIRFLFSSTSTLMLKVIHDEIKEGNPIRVFWQVSIVLFGVILFISLVLLKCSSYMVNLVFGSEWIQVSKIISIMCFALLFSAAVSSLSSIFAATNHLGLLAIWQMTNFAFSLVFFLYTLLFLDLDMAVFFELLAIKEICLYGLYFLMISFSVHKPNIR